MRLVFAVSLFLAVTSLAFAQKEYPRAELFGGYSYLRVDKQGVTGPSLDLLCNTALGFGTCPAGTFGVRSGFNGWNAAAQVNASRWWSIKADLSGHYGTPVTISSAGVAFLSSQGITGLPPKANSFSYLLGPAMSQRFSRFTLFGHALFGANREAINLHLGAGPVQIPAFAVSHTALGMAFGGGIDYKVAPHFAVRGQADYLYTRHDVTSIVPGFVTHQNNLRTSVGLLYGFGGAKPVSTPSSHTLPHLSGTVMQIPTLEITTAAGDTPGAVITDEAPQGVAALAGLHLGDVINSVDGKPINTPMELAVELSKRGAGDKVRVSYLVRGSWQTESIILLAH
jgi:opacity protein-like surface antigen